MSDLFSATGDPLQVAKAPKLPNMNEFSPGVVGDDVQALLKLIASAKGDKGQAVDKIVKAHNKITATPSQKERRKRAGNVLIGMSQCGLIEKDGRLVTATLTDLGKDVHSSQPRSDRPCGIRSKRT